MPSLVTNKRVGQGQGSVPRQYCYTCNSIFQTKVLVVLAWRQLGLDELFVTETLPSSSEWSWMVYDTWLKKISWSWNKQGYGQWWKHSTGFYIRVLIVLAGSPFTFSFAFAFNHRCFRGVLSCQISVCTVWSNYSCCFCMTGTPVLCQLDIPLKWFWNPLGGVCSNRK